ncbi:SMP-30/gluconolactonase/LRE family protein [Virgibacillus sp. W0181]|uniref:SMP-30/gluconolactonase/LRE family protein n=1 Tax=Virgibacillus sp. W0181 TaxID=3391581 RepID=UPI003F4707B0
MGSWELVQNEQAQLGESPSWDHINQILYWVDSIKGNLYIYDPKNDTHRKIEIKEHIGCVAPKNQQELVMAINSGIYSFHLKNETKTLIHDPDKNKDNIFNDGKCDPAGRFWVGTVNSVDANTFSGELFCIDRDLDISTKLDSIGCSNGITWSPDNTLMYYIDTLAFEIASFNYNVETGEISNRRVVVKILDEFKLADGMSGDSEGMLWVAHWDAGVIARWNPYTGKLLDSISLPAPRVTSCVFGGEKLNELYITSAREGLSKKELEAYPYSGGLFRVKLNVQGLPTYSFM